MRSPLLAGARTVSRHGARRISLRLERAPGAATEASSAGKAIAPIDSIERFKFFRGRGRTLTDDSYSSASREVTVPPKLIEEADGAATALLAGEASSAGRRNSSDGRRKNKNGM